MRRVLWWLFKPWWLVTRVIAVWATSKLRPTAELERLQREIEALKQTVAQLDEDVLHARRERDDARAWVEKYREAITRAGMRMPAAPELTR